MTGGNNLHGLEVHNDGRRRELQLHSCLCSKHVGVPSEITPDNGTHTFVERHPVVICIDGETGFFELALGFSYRAKCGFTSASTIKAGDHKTALSASEVHLTHADGRLGFLDGAIEVFI